MWYMLNGYLIFVVSLCALSTEYRQAPHIRYGPKDVTVARGQKVELSCINYGNPQPIVTWYKDGVRVNMCANTNITVEGTLLIDPVRRNSKQNDEGVYYCEANNSVSSDTSGNATLTIQYIGRSFQESPTNQTTPLFGSTLFQCKPPGGNPVPKVVWKKDDVTVDSAPGSDFQVSQDGGVHILKIRRVYWQDRGLYTCVASNVIGERKSLPAELTIPIPIPNVAFQKDKLPVYETKTATLKCVTPYLPLPDKTVITRSDGKMLPNSRSRVTSNSLIISNLHFSDSGTYKCTATSSAGSKTVTGELVVYSDLEFAIRPTDSKVGIDKTVIFDCKSKGGKNAIISWRHRIQYKYEGHTIASARIYVTSDYRFVIKRVEFADEMYVTCILSDKELGAVITSRVKLTVLKTSSEAPSVNVYPLSTSAKEGTSTTLSCTAKGDGDLTFSWLLAKFNAVLTAGTSDLRMKSFMGGSNLTLDNVRMTDAGPYRCKASGSGGTNSKIVTIEVIPSTGNKPSQITSIKVYKIQSNSVKLSWIAPNTLSLSPITSYEITIKNIKDGIERKKVIIIIDQTETTIRNLLPATTYMFAILAKNKIGSGLSKETAYIETLPGSVTVSPSNTKTTPIDKLITVTLVLTAKKVTQDSIIVEWNHIKPTRITGYTLHYRIVGEKDFQSVSIKSNMAVSYVLRNLNSDQKYELKLEAVNKGYVSPPSAIIYADTKKKMIVTAPKNLQIIRNDEDTLLVQWEAPDGVGSNDVTGYKIFCLESNRKLFHEGNVNSVVRKYWISSLDPTAAYYVYMTVKLKDSVLGEKTVEQRIILNQMVIGGGRKDAGSTTKTGSGFLKIVKEAWFIATIGALVWLILLITVVLLCCRRARKRQQKDTCYESSRGLLNGSRSADFPNTSLSREPLRDPSFRWSESHGESVLPPLSKSSIRSCCKSQTSSLDEDFPNRAEIKPFMNYTRHESIEMRSKASNGDINYSKENNIGIAMKNGCMVDTPLNNEVNHSRFQDYNSDRQYSSGDDRPRLKIQGSLAQPVQPNSGNIPRRQFKTDSVERRHAEIVRTAAKKFPDAELVNVMENNPQASWKRDKEKDYPKGTRPPGENTLRRQGKSPFKPLPKLEVLNWADGLPNSSKAPSTNDGSQPSSPKMSSSASMFSDGNDMRADSRMSHGGSSNSLNKYPRRRNSNASSMMSSELYQSEMDPSGYSDVASDRKRKKEKSVPPPIDLDGLTSDILLQWAESVTNSSPSSSGSSSPSRLSAISSEGSIYTDEDFAQAVAAVVECGGFNMDYDYSLPGMPGAQQPILSNRNKKMNKIDEVLAQRSKMRNTPAGIHNKSRTDNHSPSPNTNAVIPPMSMTSYLTGSHKHGPPSTHSAPSGIPRAAKHRGSTNASEKNLLRYGTGFQDVDSASTTSTPLTMSNLMHHDSSLERDKKDGAKPLTVSNLRHHDTSLDRVQKQCQIQSSPTTPHVPPPNNQNGYKEQNRHGGSNSQLVPEAPLSVTSALERNESINSNSKDSANSSNKQDSEVENKTSTSERKPKQKKYFVNMKDPLSSTGTASTVRTSPEYPSDTEC